MADRPRALAGGGVPEEPAILALPRGPRLDVLGADAVDRIHRETLEVLERVGVGLASARLLDRLDAAGATVDHARQRARFPAALVEEALARRPASFVLAGRRPGTDLELDGVRGYLALDGCAAEIVDHETGARRPSTREDLALASRLADALPEIGLLWQPVTARDVPKRVQPLHELHAQLTSSTKHIQMMTAVTPAAARGVIEIARAVAGGGEELRRRPVVSAFQCSLSPLSYEAGALEAAVVYAEAGLPCGFVVMPIACATAPAGVAAALVQTNAEVLAGVVILRTLAPGAATFYGACTTVMDLRSGAAACGGPEDLFFQLAAAQMARRYRLPASVGTFATGAKTADWQAGLENGLSGLASCLAGAELLCGAGLLHGARVFSMTQVVLDCETFNLLRHLAAMPAAVAAADSAVPLLADVGPGGQFLSHRDTLRTMRQQWLPRLFDRTSYEEWLAAGRPGPSESAAERVRQVLKSHQPEPLDEALEREILAIIEAWGQRPEGATHG